MYIKEDPPILSLGWKDIKIYLPTSLSSFFGDRERELAIEGLKERKEMKSLERKLTMAGRKLPLDEHWPYKHILNT